MLNSCNLATAFISLRLEKVGKAKTFFKRLFIHICTKNVIITTTMQWQTVRVLPICTRKMWHQSPYGEKGTSKGNLFTKKQIKNKNGPSFVQFTNNNSQGTDFSQFKLIAITFSTFHLPWNKMIASKPINNLPSTSSRSRFLSMATKSQELLDNGQLSRRTCAWIIYLWIYK